MLRMSGISKMLPSSWQTQENLLPIIQYYFSLIQMALVHFYARLSISKILFLTATILPILSAQNPKLPPPSKFLLLQPNQQGFPLVQIVSFKQPPQPKRPTCQPVPSPQPPPNPLLNPSTSFILTLSTISFSLENCQLQDNQQHCLVCSKGFVINDEGLCIPRANPHNITEREFERDCGIENIRGPSGECIEMAPNCLTYTTCGRCLSCPRGMENYNGRCRPMLLQSLYLDPTNQENSGCVALANKENGQCVTQDPYCNSIRSDGTCGYCQYGFELKFMVCVTREPLNFDYREIQCEVWEDGKCIGCYAGWSLNQQKRCEPEQIGQASKELIVSDKAFGVLPIEGNLDKLSHKISLSSSIGFVDNTFTANKAPEKQQKFDKKEISSPNLKALNTK